MLLKTIDLCAGIGGIRRGFELTGAFKNVLAAEIDRFACLTYAHLYGEDAHNDLTTKEFKEKLDSVSYDVLLAGFPCQSFSMAGLKEGFNDKEKGVIFEHIAEIIERTKPRSIFLENVDNLVRHDKGNTFKTIIEILEITLKYKVIGVTYDPFGKPTYNVKNFIRNSKNFGIPQNRPRTYIMAFDKIRYGLKSLERIETYLPEKNDCKLYKDLNDLLEFGAEPKYYMATGYLETLIRHREREHKKGNGFGYRIVNASDVKHPVANTIMATGGSGKERNLVYDPQERIGGMVIRGKRTPLNNQGIRVMTPREWGKLQGFVNYAFMDSNGNDCFSFPEGIALTQQYKQFGNAVTIPVIKTMAEYMLNCFKILGDIPKD